MITPRASRERRHDSRREQLWQTFDSENRADALADGFATLQMLNEDHLAPGFRVARHPYRDAEILTYVRAGAVAYEDSLGRTGVIRAGEFQRMSASRDVRHGEANASRTERAHVFHLWLRPRLGELDPLAHEQNRFSAAERRGVLCVVASEDARGGSLRIRQDAVVFSAILEPGQHVVHALADGHRAWLHIVEGEAALGGAAMQTGDGAGVVDERALSITARERTEILLVDFGRPPSSALL